PDALALAAIDRDGVAGGLVRPRRARAHREAPGERLTGDGEARLGGAAARHRDGLRVRLAHAAVARHSVELHRVTAWGEAAVARSPARRDALALGPIDHLGIAAVRTRLRRR